MLILHTSFTYLPYLSDVYNKNNYKLNYRIFYFFHVYKEQSKSCGIKAGIKNIFLSNQEK